LEVLEEILDGIAYVKTFEVVSSTFQTLTRLSPTSDLLQNANRGSARMDRLSCETNV